MKFSKILLFGIIPNSIYAWLSTQSSKLPAVVTDVHPSSKSPLELNPSNLLEESRLKPNFYAAAMLEIKRLEEKPICHRMAAQLLVKNCQGLKDLDVQEYQVASEGMQRHHVESFAASLALCDMDRARFDTPNACNPFRSAALETALRTSGKLSATPDDVSYCLQGLGQDHSHWSTWLSYRDSSLLLCRGASIELEKDEALKFQKKFIKMMVDFTDNMYSDLRDLSRNMADYSRETKSVYEESKKQAENFKIKFQETFESVAEDMKDANLRVKSILGGTNDAYRMIRNLVTTVVESNAELAAEQENAIAVSTSNLKTSLGGINDLVIVHEGQLLNMQEVMTLMISNVNKLAERQNAMEESSQNTLSALINATELVQSHEHKLNEASHKASVISAVLDKASTSSRRLGTWEHRLDWTIRTLGPVVFLLGGNYGIVPTVKNNIFLMFAGYVVGESINILRYAEWGCFMDTFLPTWIQERLSIEDEQSVASSPPVAPTWKGRINLSNISSPLPTTTTPIQNTEMI